MDFIEGIKNLSDRITAQKDLIHTEEATKMVCVVPFINLLGYDTSDLTEVFPEFVADVGIKQGEKVDYAILKDEQVIMLIECKRYAEGLSSVHTSQLFRYFAVVPARIAVLTNGVSYQFYADLEKTNIMDSTPFLEFDMFNVQQPLINELKQFTKPNFDLDTILTVAHERKEAGTRERTVEPSIKPNPPSPKRSRTSHVFTFEGNRYEVNTWVEYLVKFCEILSYIRSEQFEQVLRLDLGQRRPYFSRNPDELTNPCLIKETGIYVHTYFDRYEIKKIIRRLADRFNCDEPSLEEE